MGGQSILAKRKIHHNLEIKEQLFVELWIMYLQKSLWEVSMMRWSMYGVLEFCAMSYALGMPPSSHQKADNKLTEKY